MTTRRVKILGVISGDPFNPKTWSSSSYYLFTALKRYDWLCEAISARPSKPVDAFYKLMSFHPVIERWKFKYHINVGYFNQQTKAALVRLQSIDSADYNVILQIGAWYDLTKIKDKVTVSYHDGNFQTFLNSPYGYPAVSRRYIDGALRYERELYAKLDRLFTMSKWLAGSFMSDFGVQGEKVVPVGAGINLPYVKEVTDQQRHEDKILFVGIDFERKGGRYLLEAFARVKKEIPKATLTIIGPRLVGLPEGVRCLSYVSKEDAGGLEILLDEYASSSVFVLPSLYEPFGIALVEAMAHRLPCVGTNVCAIPEIIDHGVTGFVVAPRDSRALADRLIEVLRDTKGRTAMGNSAHAKYSKDYTWDQVTQKMVEAIPAN